MGYELGYVDYDELDDYADGRCEALGESLRKGIERQLLESFVIGQISRDGLPKDKGGSGKAEDAMCFDEWFSVYWLDTVLVAEYGARTVAKAFQPVLSRVWGEWRREVEDRDASAIPSRH